MKLQHILIDYATEPLNLWFPTYLDHLGHRYDIYKYYHLNIDLKRFCVV